MSTQNYIGKIHKTPVYEYTVYCAGCTEAETIHHPSLKEAAANFREVGWKLIRGEWHCSACVAVKESETK